MSDPVFDKFDVAKQVRDCYTRLIRARGGVWEHWRPSDRLSNVWVEAASICLQHGFTAEDHVTALLGEIRRPQPTMLLGERAVERTEKYVNRANRNDYWDFCAQLGQVRCANESGEDVEQVLADTSRDFSPAFRYCLAANCGFDELAGRYKDAARQELLMKPKLREMLSRMLPEAYRGVLEC